MNPPFETPDPLVQAMLDDASELPQRACAAAHRERARRAHRRRACAGGVAMLLIGLSGWTGWQYSCGLREATRERPPSHEAAAAAAEFVKVETEEDAFRNPPALPNGLSRDQRELLIAARGMPLLLVKDGAGKVKRIDVIER